MSEDWTRWLTKEERELGDRYGALAPPPYGGSSPTQIQVRGDIHNLLRSLAASREEVAEMKAYWIPPDKADSVAYNLEGRAVKAEAERDASRALVAETREEIEKAQEWRRSVRGLTYEDERALYEILGRALALTEEEMLK